ncbi:MAG TPA: recombinase family protein [Solirubrobacteraceae bacterium]
MGQSRAIGIVRVSQTRGREGESFTSPTTQLSRIRGECERRGAKLLRHHEELDVSGTRPLEKRKGLLEAVEAVEAGQADVIIVAYFDRLVRSIKVQAEVVQRIELAGGNVLTLDAGQITNGGAAGTLQANILGAIAEYAANQTREKVAEAQVVAVARGATPWARVPLGYTRSNGTLSPNPAEVAIVQRAFEMRNEGATITEIRGMLKAHGIERSHRGVQVLLANRIYLGEVHFGKLINLHACEPTIDRALWERVQKRKVPRGPRPKSDHLLARLGVLRCGSCNSRLSSAIMPQGGGYPIYRCGSTNDCDRHMVISAAIVEDEIIAWVKHHLAGLVGTASGAAGVSEAQAELERAQVALDAALRSFTDAGLTGEPVAVETLDELREAREQAKERYDDAIQAQDSLAVAVTVGDWDDLSADGRRDLIRALIKRVLINPGRGVERIEIEAR